ncbi:MAG TPA: glycosyltransferase [Candidatus Sulfotelmatobacter sp.]|nr:glycosyltransferase [Candidatus Sulfotelmatobacter sp.]
MSSLRVTVAIITYNRSRFLRQALAGIVRQDFPSDRWELLVIDNNSTDDTRDVVTAFVSANPAPRRVVETRQGLDFGRNRAVEEARGDLIVLVDDDILVETDWLAQLVAPFSSENAHKIGVVGGEVVPVFPDGIPAWLEGSHRPLGFRSEPGPLPPNQAPMGANFAFPKWVFVRFGMFDTRLDRQGSRLFGGGDSQMIRRLRTVGLEAWFVPGAKVLHQISAERLTLGYALRHAFDSARSRVADHVRILRESGGSAFGFMASRAAVCTIKLIGFLLLAVASMLALRSGAARRALVRAWRCCGYVFQIARTGVGKD